MAATHEEPPEAAVKVADPEEYNQTQRLRAINNARQRVEDTIEQSMVRLVTDNEFDEDDRRQVVRATLYTYLSNVYWLMVDADATDIVNQTEFGKVVVDPPEEFQRVLSERHREYPRPIGATELKPFTYTIRGIKGYLEAPDPFEPSWMLQLQKRHGKPETVERTLTEYMPVHISRNVFSAANGFLNRAGFDANLKESQHRAVVDEELIEEVEEWRKQNIQ